MRRAPLRSSMLRVALIAGAAVLASTSLLGSAALAGPTYTYDALGRVILVTYANGKQVIYKYDKAGNRTQEVVSATTVNHKPVATTDTITVYDDALTTTFDPRTNDTGDAPLALFSVSGGDFGASSLNSGHTAVTYTATSHCNASDQLLYVIQDTNGLDATGTINVSIVNKAPVTVADAISTSKGVAKTFDPRANDSDPGGDALTVSANSTPTHGSVTIGSGGTSMVYTPTSGYYGTDSFTYTVKNPCNTTATGTVNATVTFGTNAPVAVADSYSIRTGDSRTVDPRTNDTDADSGDTRTITAKTNGTHGTVTIGGGGTSVTYASAAGGWTGNDTFTYTISDIDNRTATATVTMAVGANHAPVAVADSVSWYSTWIPHTIHQQGSTAFKPSMSIDPRWNDTDAEGDTLTVTGKTNGTIGTVTQSGNTLTWTKNSNVTGAGSWTDSFTYTISDGHGGTATGTVSVDVEVDLADMCGPDPC